MAEHSPNATIESGTSFEHSEHWNRDPRGKQLDSRELRERQDRLICDCQTLRRVEREHLLNCGAISAYALKRNANGDKPDLTTLTKENYFEYFSSRMRLEFAQVETELRRFDLRPVKISRVLYRRRRINGKMKFEYRNSFIFKGLTRSKIGLTPIVHCLVLTGERGNRHSLGQVQRVSGNKVYFRTGTCKYGSFENLIFEHTLEPGYYAVRVVCSLAMQDRIDSALDCLASNSRLLDSLFSDPNYCRDFDRSKLIIDREVILGEEPEEVELNERLKRLNDSQFQAFCCISRPECLSRPYLVHGPPGTGKTATLVEMVVQISNRKLDKYERLGRKILVTASSNCCTDKLARDLYATGMVGSISRLMSATHANTFGPSKQKPKYFTKDLEKAFEAQVLVTTNNMAGFLVSKRGSFDSVFIDEAGNAMEPEIIMPMLYATQERLIVLAGDHKQLGPVVKSREAQELGLGKSILLRLTEEVEQYKYKPNEGYDPRYATRLDICYRCDPRIMQQSNESFYDNKLKCLNQTPEWLLEKLEVKGPVLFVSVPDGREQTQGGPNWSTSKYNQRELDVCVQLARWFGDSVSLGVTSLYKLQANKLRAALEGSLSDFNEEGQSRHKVDTVDGFQGSEREVIIVSLVRTPRGDPPEQLSASELIFIDDEKRFNVALTRAKWLTIVVGHEQTARASRLWSKYLERAVVCDLKRAI